MEPCSMPLPFLDGASIQSSGTQCYSPEMITHGLCGYSAVMTSWISATVLVDGLHWPHRCLRWTCQFFNDVVPGGSPQRGWLQMVPIFCRRCLNHEIVWHIDTPGAIGSHQAGLQHTHCPFSVDDCETLASLFWNEVFLQCPAYTWLQTFRCVVWWNPISENSESIPWRLSNPCLVLLVWSRAYTMRVEEINSYSCEGGNFPASHCWVMQKVRPLDLRFFFVQYIKHYYNMVRGISAPQYDTFWPCGLFTLLQFYI